MLRNIIGCALLLFLINQLFADESDFGKKINSYVFRMKTNHLNL